MPLRCFRWAMLKRVSVMLGSYQAPKIGKIGVLLAVMLLAQPRGQTVPLNQLRVIGRINGTSKNYKWMVSWQMY